MNSETSSEDTASSTSFGFLNRPSWEGSYDGARGPTQMRAQHLAIMAYFLAEGVSESQQSAPQSPSPGQS